MRLFFWQLEKAREATDEANLRAAYAEVVNAQLTEMTSDELTTANNDVKVNNEGTYTKFVEAKQDTAKWSGSDSVEIGGIAVTATNVETEGYGWTVTITKSGVVSFPETAKPASN